MYTDYCNKGIIVIARKSVGKKITTKEKYEIFLFIKYNGKTGFHGIVNNNIDEKNLKIWHQYYCKCVEKYGRLIIRKMKL